MNAQTLNNKLTEGQMYGGYELGMMGYALTFDKVENDLFIFICESFGRKYKAVKAGFDFIIIGLYNTNFV